MDTPAAGGSGAPAHIPQAVAPGDAVFSSLVEQIMLLRAETASAASVAAARHEALRAELAALRACALESPSATSYGTIGTEALLALEQGSSIATAHAPPEGATGADLAPIASLDDLRSLCACSTESELVALITPLLQAARGLEAGAAADPCARVLINSERSPWLDSLAAPLPADQLKRPDLFVTWAPFWSGRLTAHGGAVGKLAARALQKDGCVSEFYEAKLGQGDLTATDFGQLVDYHSRVSGPVRGMLFNARHFWLLESRRHIPVALIKGKLGAPGSAALLRRFFNAASEPPLVPLLRHLCSALSVLPRSIAVDSLPVGGGGGGGAQVRSSAFLGAGGSARVFCVAREGATRLSALKASTSQSRAELQYEYAAMQHAAALGAPVVPVVEDSLAVLMDATTGAYRGGGFLLREVCVRAAVDSRAQCTAAFEALRALHSCSLVHGDARLPNLMRSEGSGLLWIDLRESAAGVQGGQRVEGQSAGALHAAQRTDARVLAASVLGLTQGDALPAPVLEVLLGVPHDAAAYAALASAVGNALQL